MNPPIWNATLIKKLRSTTNRSPHWPYDVWHSRLFYELCFLNLASWRWQKGCGGHILSVPKAVVITYSPLFCITRYMISQHPTSWGKGRGGGTDSSIWILVIIVGVFCLVDKLRNETIAYLGCREIRGDSMKSKMKYLRMWFRIVHKNVNVKYFMRITISILLLSHLVISGLSGNFSKTRNLSGRSSLISDDSSRSFSCFTCYINYYGWLTSNKD